mgnify:CR=1 FL=1
MKPDWRYIEGRMAFGFDWSHIKPYEFHPVVEFIVALFYFVFIYYLMHYFAKSKIKSRSLRAHFVPGWIARVSGGLFVYLFYLFYYGWGDTIAYLRDSKVMLILIYEMPLQSLQYFFLSIKDKDFLNSLLNSNDVYYFAIYRTNYFIQYAFDYNSEMVALFTVPFMVLGIGLRYASLIIVSTFSFLASWFTYLVFVRRYPRYSGMLSIPLLYLPSLNVWTGSPFKETYAIIGISLLVYGTYQLLYRGKWGWIPFMVFGAWMAYTVKPYVALAILPWVLIWIYFSLNKKVNHPLYHYFFSPVILIAFVGLAYFGILSLGEQTKKYSLENIPNQAYLVYIDLKNNYTYYQETGGSVYDIGDFEPTIPGMLSKFPIAFLTATFRPFLWEANKTVVLLAALETFALTIITLINLFHHGIVRIVRKAVSDPFLIFCFGYSVLFLFMVGLTSGNFGNLVRYRLPGYIFFLSALFVCFGKLRDEDKANRYRRRQQWTWSGAGGRPTGLAG